MLDGEPWHTPPEDVARWWADRAVEYQSATHTAQDAKAQPAGEVAHLVMAGKTIGKRPN